jgi:predicted RNA-binding Zn-ribbon protein involved in translation (DUF1610 family)
MKAIAVIETDVEAVEDTDQPIAPDAIERIESVEEHDEWEPGQPCPECGNTELSVMGLDEDKYHSEDGETYFVAKGEAIGPETSWICPNCMTELRHLPISEIVGEL